jgi:hypothetical protein
MHRFLLLPQIQLSMDKSHHGRSQYLQFDFARLD